MNKRQLRARFKALRRQHGPALQQRLNQLGASDLEGLLVLRSAQPLAGGHLGLCWPLADEPDLRPWLQHLNQPLALPAVAGGRLLYRAWRPGQPLQPDDCGIPAPAGPPLEAQQLALLLVPALVVLPAACVCDRLPADPWDVLFDGWLDERGCHWIGADPI